MFRFAPLTYVISVLCASGCAFESSGVGGGTDGETTGEETGGESTGFTRTATGSSATTVASASGTGAGGSESTSDSPTSASTTTDDPTTDSTTGGSPSDLGSCEELLAADATAPSGPHLIVDAVNRPVSVYCDMESSGGGWTLVARSVPGGSSEDGFGWGSSRGAISSPSEPYSLDVASVGIEFTELLVGNRGSGYGWGSNVYRLELPNGFLSNTDNSVPVSNLSTVKGNCDPPGGPEMLRNAGYSGRDDVFWLRDETDFRSQYGLEPDGFNLFYEFSFSCNRGAELSGDSGMIFVR